MRPPLSLAAHGLRGYRAGGTAHGRAALVPALNAAMRSR